MERMSIVIPVYNRAQVVQRTLASVLAQTFRPVQVVLVDNCSTDSTLHVLNDFKASYSTCDFEVIVTQEEQHTAGAARNRGFTEAGGDWVMFFDSDDEMHPRLVERYMSKLRGNDIVAVKARLHKADGSYSNLAFATRDILANQIIHSILGTQRYCVRSKFVAQAGLWDDSLASWNDWELGVRMLLKHPKMAFIDDTLVTINESGKDSITGTGFGPKHGQWEQVIDQVEREIAESHVTDQDRYLRLLDYKRVVLAAHYSREGHDGWAQALYSQAMTRLGSKWLTRTVVPMLYGRIKRGKRGSGQIARIII